MKNVDVTPILDSKFCSHGYYGNNLYADGYYGYSIYSDGFYGNSHNAIDFYGNSHHSDGNCYSGHIKAMSVPSFLNVAPPFTAVGRTMTVRLLLPSMQCTGFPTVTFNSLPNLKNIKMTRKYYKSILHTHTHTHEKTNIDCYLRQNINQSKYHFNSLAIFSYQ